MRRVQLTIIMLVSVCVFPVFAVNALNESFNGAFDQTWNTWSGGTFSDPAGTYDFMTISPANGIKGVYQPNFNITGSGGSWSEKTVWTNLWCEGNETELTTKVKLNASVSGGSNDSDFRFALKAKSDGVRLYAQINDPSGNSPNVSDYYLSATMPSSYTSYMELTVFGPKDWQMDYSYDIGGGKVLVGSLTDSSLSPTTLFDPTMQNFRSEVYMYTQSNSSNMGSLDNWSIVPEPCTLLLLGLGGVALRKRKELKNKE